MSRRRLDIGIASFKSAQKLQKTIQSIQRYSITDYRLIIVHNQDGTPENDAAHSVAMAAQMQNPSKVRVIPQPNSGYAGAVNRILQEAETEYIAYLDNDAYTLTAHWDETLCGYLDRFHEIGIVFPGSGVNSIPRPQGYLEVMWAPGFCWVVSRMCVKDTGLFDAEIGHQEEADYAMRVRMAGYRCAAIPAVYVEHAATSTNDPASIERINAGIVRWVDKWNRYFNGKNFNYHSPNVTRWEDWPPNALYMEEYWRSKLPGLNDNPESVTIDNRQYDLIKVPRLKGFYTGRII